MLKVKIEKKKKKKKKKNKKKKKKGHEHSEWIMTLHNFLNNNIKILFFKIFKF